jgi:hypothetical protein
LPADHLGHNLGIPNPGFLAAMHPQVHGFPVNVTSPVLWACGDRRQEHESSTSVQLPEFARR